MRTTVASRDRITLHGGWLQAPEGQATPARVQVGREPLLVGRDAACAMVVDDRSVSAVHAELVATDRGVRLRDVGSRNGTWVGDVRIAEVYLTAAATLTVSGVVLAFEPARPERIAVPGADSLGRIVGSSPAMRALYDRIERVARTDLTVLVQGETGTGKELVAYAIHELSPRKDRPFVVIDCGAITPSLAEAVLFGHERGAFTGAVDKRVSPFVEADGGTVFLDELGELPVDVQPKLLRALAERRIKPVGGSAYREVDVRVVAATRRDLGRAINEGTFRSDLYFRVAQVRLNAPPLRDRLGDVPALVRRALAEIGAEGAYRRISRESLERLMRHDWPGNVRELRSAVAAAWALSDPRGPIDVASQLGAAREEADAPEGAASDLSYHDAKRAALDRFEREYFAPHVAATGCSVAEIARRTSLERAHVRRYLKQHGLLKRGG